MTTHRKIGRWMLLFPVTYALHILEEYVAGEGFPAWAARTSGSELTNLRFLMMTLSAGAALTMAIMMALKVRQLEWLPITISAVFLLNTITHTVGTIRTSSYSPGLVTAWLLWAPLSITTLIYLRDIIRPGRYVISMLVGLAIHGIVSLAAS
jgi:hypothetical protein